MFLKTLRWLNLVVALALIAALALTVRPAAARPVALDYDRETPYVPGEVIVGFNTYNANLVKAQAAALAGTVDAQVVEQYGNMALLSFGEDADVFALAARLSGASGVAFAEPNYISWIPEDGQYLIGKRDGKLTEVRRVTPDGREFTVSINALKAMRTLRGAQYIPTYPNDAWDNWGWSDVRADIIWPNTAISPMVCVVDTGVDYLHPDLSGKVLNGWDFVNNDALPNDDNGHGTHVAGVIAARMNNGKGLAGVSNGNALAVKVLSAQGWGTAFDIASGITYCANNFLVKVINMSLGGRFPSAAEYSALQYAINTKGKLVVAAAGNSGLAWNTVDGLAPSFPAGWASSAICSNGTYGGPGCNNISHGLIAVGAGRAWSSDELWVDKNGDGSESPGELYWPSQCATWFSNYGSWVEIVAPGQDIFSTTPTSYPFWSGYYGGASSPYDTWNGTSMAAPHVAGGAARTWSVFPTYTNAQIKARLIATGRPLSLASDPRVQNPFVGYADSNYLGEAPFCWPDGFYNYGSYSFWVDMSNSVYLNVAGAMGRGATWAWVSEATTGLPLPDATVQAFSGVYLRDTARTPRDWPWTDLINLPGGSEYTLKVSKPGYTLGAQTFGSVYVFPGGWNSDISALVSLGVSTRIHGVLDWWGRDDLDLYLWLPYPASPGGVVGPGYSGHPNDFGAGLFTDFPRARWNRDGGAGDWGGVESISITPKPGFPTYPYYVTPPMIGQGYDFLVTDYGSGALDWTPMVFRYWVGGVLKGMAIKNCTNSGTEWWEPGYVGWGVGANFVSWNMCGDVSLWPYATRGGLSTTQRP